MNILHIANIDVNSSGGGTNLVVPQFVGKQNNQEDCYAQLLVVNKPKVEIKIKHSFDISFYSSLGNFDHFLSNSDPDIVIFHSVYQLPYYSIYKKLLKRNIPYVIVSHGSLSRECFNKNIIKKGVFKFLFLNNFVKKSSKLCFTLEGEQKNSIYLKKSYMLQPNCIPYLNKFSSKNRSEITKIIFVGKIDIYYKGIDMLVKALASIKNFITSNNVYIDFYGYGDEKDIAFLNSKISKLELLSNISYMGPIYDDEKIEALSQSDIFILTSRSEAMPLSVQEALACGIPAILSPGTNMDQIVVANNAGWSTAEHRGIDSTIVSAIKDYKADSESYRINARRVYEELFDPDKIAIETIKGYKDIIRKYND